MPSEGENQPVNNDTNGILLRIEQLVRAMLRAMLSEKLDKIRADKVLRLIYDLTGRSDVKTIARRAGVSTGKVSGIWQTWEDTGLVVKEGKSYRRLLD